MTVVFTVEDDKNQLLFYEKELALEGYEVITAANGMEALDKVHKPRRQF
ncbi:MAG: hypothetical protein ACYSR1_03025 [Planctomycetota bacterium]|jgi:DNA-binding NtrC family response regulator